MSDGRRVLAYALAPALLWPGREMQPRLQHLHSSASRACHPYLFNVYQLSLVDLRNGDVMLGSDGEPPLEKI